MAFVTTAQSRRALVLRLSPSMPFKGPVPGQLPLRRRFPKRAWLGAVVGRANVEKDFKGVAIKGVEFGIGNKTRLGRLSDAKMLEG